MDRVILAALIGAVGTIGGGVLGGIIARSVRALGSSNDAKSLPATSWNEVGINLDSSR